MATVPVLTIHNVVQSKLEGEKFSFLLHCKTCGWEARGFDNVGPSSDDLKKGHLGARLEIESGVPEAIFGSGGTQAAAGQASSFSAKEPNTKVEADKQAYAKQAESLKPSEVVMSPLTLEDQLKLSDELRKIDEEAAKQKGEKIEAAQQAVAERDAPKPQRPASSSSSGASSSSSASSASSARKESSY